MPVGHFWHPGWQESVNPGQGSPVFFNKTQLDLFRIEESGGNPDRFTHLVTETFM